MGGAAVGVACGIYVTDAMGVRVSGSTVSAPGHAGSGPNGILENACKGLLISNNAVSDTLSGVYLSGGSGLSVAKNNLSSNQRGLFGSTFDGSLIEENILNGNSAYGLYLVGLVATPNVLYRNNTAQGNTATNYIAGTATNGGGNL